MTQDPVSTTAENTTGSITAGRRKSWPPRDIHLTKGDWIRIVVWFVPIIFMAATMYVSVDNLSDKAIVHDKQLGELNGNQKVLTEKVGEVGKKQDRLIITTDKMDDKLDGQGEDLAAIKTKLKIKDDS